MRWLAGLVVLGAVVGGDAAARIVISDPPIVRACRTAKTWELVAGCLAKQGAITVERTLPRARLVRVIQTSDGASYDAGVYLYLQAASGSWTIGGMFQGAPYTVTGLAPLTIENHQGYRMEVGQILRTTVSLDGVTSVPVILSTKRVLFCGGDTYGCPDATTQCDVLFHGKAMWTFRGTLAFEKGLVRVIGDRSRGGQTCVPSERVFLGWPVGPALP